MSLRLRRHESPYGCTADGHVSPILHGVSPIPHCTQHQRDAQLSHVHRRAVRVDDAALLHELVRGRRRAEDDDLLAERLEVHNVAMFLYERAVRLPLLLGRDVEQVPDQRERPRAGRERERAAPAPLQHEQRERAGERGGEVRRGGVQRRQAVEGQRQAVHQGGVVRGRPCG
jgi:hypothetical protein